MSEDYRFNPVLSEEEVCQLTSPQEAVVVLTLLYETVGVSGEKALGDC